MAVGDEASVARVVSVNPKALMIVAVVDEAAIEAESEIAVVLAIVSGRRKTVRLGGSIVEAEAVMVADLEADVIYYQFGPF